MNGMFLDRKRKDLEALRTQILRSIVDEHEELGGLLSDNGPKDLGDLAADHVSRQNLETLAAQDQRKLRRIGQALQRIQDGRYGICESCGNRIPEGRLEVLPDAFLCLPCQKRLERLGAD
jgi:DnaK suppressor protein